MANQDSKKIQKLGNPTSTIRMAHLIIADRRTRGIAPLYSPAEGQILLQAVHGLQEEEFLDSAKRDAALLAAEARDAAVVLASDMLHEMGISLERPDLAITEFPHRPVQERFLEEEESVGSRMRRDSLFESENTQLRRRVREAEDALRAYELAGDSDLGDDEEDRREQARIRSEQKRLARLSRRGRQSQTGRGILNGAIGFGKKLFRPRS